MDEVFWIHPTNTTEKFWFITRLYVTELSETEILVRKTGNVVE